MWQLHVEKVLFKKTFALIPRQQAFILLSEDLRPTQCNESVLRSRAQQNCMHFLNHSFIQSKYVHVSPSDGKNFFLLSLVFCLPSGTWQRMFQQPTIVTPHRNVQKQRQLVDYLRWAAAAFEWVQKAKQHISWNRVLCYVALVFHMRLFRNASTRDYPGIRNIRNRCCVLMRLGWAE